MKNLQAKLSIPDWQAITNEMNDKGYAIIPGLLSTRQCEELIENYDNKKAYRKQL